MTTFPSFNVAFVSIFRIFKVILVSRAKSSSLFCYLWLFEYFQLPIRASCAQSCCTIALKFDRKLIMDTPPIIKNSSEEQGVDTRIEIIFFIKFLNQFCHKICSLKDTIRSKVYKIYTYFISSRTNYHNEPTASNVFR